MKILVTGGCGYIGSHTVVSLLQAGHEVIVLDNLANGHEASLARVVTITGKKPAFVLGDVTNAADLNTLFANNPIDAVVHFAALKAVGESTQIPLEYYHCNVNGSLNLLRCMKEHGVNRLVYSSSATVYGEDAPVPYVETLPLGNPSSPYGATKAMVERVIIDTAIANPDMQLVSLRYFNPIGAHESGLIGEDPKGLPNNLLPFIAQVAVGRRDKLGIFGDDYETKDGTCERDYLHVVDLAEGHLAALHWLTTSDYAHGANAFNLGTGNAVSVMEMVKRFERVTGVAIPYEIAPRRAGDLPAFWADARKANEMLGWRCKRGLDEMLSDTWRWQSSNPNGYLN